MTIEELKNGIFITLKDKFNLPMYFEKVYQNLERPCFILNIVNDTVIQRLNNKLLKTIQFDLVYIPSDVISKKQEIYNISDEVYDLLRILEVTENDLPVKIRSLEFEFQDIDEVGHFFITYKFRDDIIEDEYPMEHLEDTYNIKEV